MRQDLAKEFPSPLDRAFRQYTDDLSKVKFVEEIMSRDPLTIDEKASMAEAAKIMGEKHIRRLLVVKKKETTGIVTARDLVEAYAR